MSEPTLYYNVEQSSLDVISGNKTTTMSSGSDTLSAVLDMVTAAYVFVQDAEATETRNMNVQLNAAIVATPPSRKVTTVTSK